MAGSPAVAAEDEFVEIGLKMLFAQAVIDADRPGLEIGKHAVDPRQHPVCGRSTDDMRQMDHAGRVVVGRFEERVRELVSDIAVLEETVEAVLRTRSEVVVQLAELHRQVLAVAKSDPVCRRLMSVPEVGAVTALAYRTAVEEPRQFRKASLLGAHFGLTPRKYASGETDRNGRITRCGDGMVRSLLCEGATELLCQVRSWNWLKRWGMDVVQRRGMHWAQIAVARRLAVILHRLWIDGTEFQTSRDGIVSAAAA